MGLGDLLGRWRGPGHDELGNALVAMRVAGGGRIPDGLWGLRIDAGGVTQRYLAGMQPAAAKEGALWWAHPGPYVVEFAASDSAPEVGVRLTVSVDFERQDVLHERFPHFLARLVEDRLDIAGLAAAVRECAGPYLLPTAATADELAVVRAGFSNRLRAAIGCQCLALERIDLGERVDAAESALAAVAPPAAEQTPSSSPPTLPASPLAAGAVRLLGPWREWRCRLATEQGLVRLDTGLGRRLFLELPRLASHFSRHSGFTEATAYVRHANALARLDRLGARAAFLPSLDSRFAAQRLPLAEREMRVAELENAGRALDELWALAGRLPLSGNESPAAWLDEFERLLANIEAAIRRRSGQADEGNA